MTIERVDRLFENAYSLFKNAVKDNPELTILEILEDYVAPKYRDAVRRRFEDEPVVVTPIASIKGRKPVWRSDYSTGSGKHWLALQMYLQSHGGRTADQVLGLDRASDKVLFGIGDPATPLSANEKNPYQLTPGIQKYSGLVIGYVQSGKTANYTALAAKAFDAGYQLVIVLTGIHNALRRQTQIRMNNELGLIASSEERPTAAENEIAGLEKILQLTNEELDNGDFHRMHLSSSDILPKGKHLCVTKKNAAVLRTLNTWLGAGTGVPTLIIDDEADQASVNTVAPVENGATDDDLLDDDIKPSTINGLIRELRAKCGGHNAYVAYTATPYANVFIDMDVDHPEYKDDLYPEDFIVSLPKPDGYMGPQEFFGPSLSGEEGGEDLSSRVIRILDNDRVKSIERLHSQYKSGEALLTEHLAEALQEFVLAVAARRALEQKTLPGSFLVHTSSKVENQRHLGERISKYIDQLIAQWRYDRQTFEPVLRARWVAFQSEMRDGIYALNFDDLIKHLDDMIGQFEGIQVKVLNFKSQDELDYEATPNLVSVIVGGNKLSRGLTLEGLLFSYFVRPTANTPQADTLTQMGRFFGYRRDILDLTRVYTTEKLRRDFREISQMEEALRADILVYERLNKTPREFAPRVQRRLGVMPTARNKMHSASLQGITYSGDLIQMTSFQDGATGLELNSKNLQATKTFLKKVLAAGQLSKISQSNGPAHRKLWRDVPGEIILDFISEFTTVEGANRFSSNNIAGYIRDLLHFQPKEGSIGGAPELTSWSVAIAGRTPDSKLGTEDFGLDFEFGRIQRSLDEGSERSIGTLINPLNLHGDEARGDEIIDFSDEDLARAKELVAQGELKAAEAVRSIRPVERGLLVIYPISSLSDGKKNDDGSVGTLGDALFQSSDSVTIPALAMVFPESNLELNEFWRQGKAD